MSQSTDQFKNAYRHRKSQPNSTIRHVERIALAGIGLDKSNELCRPATEADGVESTSRIKILEPRDKSAKVSGSNEVARTNNFLSFVNAASSKKTRIIARLLSLDYFGQKYTGSVLFHRSRNAYV